MHIFSYSEHREKKLCEKINSVIVNRFFLLYLHSILRHERAA